MLFMRTGFILIRMTAGTVRLVGRRSPGHHFGIRSVTIGASQITSVITRVTSRVMTEGQWSPVIGGMTVITLPAGGKVIRWLTRRLCTVMTGGTGARDAGVIEVRGDPGNGRMTNITGR